MRLKRPVYPKPMEVAATIGALSTLSDNPPNYHWRTSHKGVPNMRVCGMSRGVKWTVDVYARSWFHVYVNDYLNQQITGIPAMLNCLKKFVGLMVSEWPGTG